MLGRAHYLHSTVLTFSTQAYSSIISAFHAEVRNEAVQCWYDETQHVFHIECPSEHAANTDWVLGNKIKNHVSQALAAAGQDSSEQAHVQLFPEADVTALNNSLTDTEVEMASSVKTDTSTCHILVISNAELQALGKGRDFIPSVELHGLREISSEITSRIIQPDKKAARKLMQEARTCRMVRWDEDEACYVAERISKNESSNPSAKSKAQSLDLIPFHVLYDERTKTEAEPTKEVESGIDTIEWITAVEKADVLEPEAMQEMPKETRKLLVQQPRTAARVRIPKGITLEEEEDTEVQCPDENDAQVPEIPASAFSEVPRIAQIISEDLAQDSSGAFDQNSVPRVDTAFLSVPSQAITSVKSSEYPIMQDDFGSWGKGFSVVDKYGLTTNLDSAAQLDLEQRRQRQLAAWSKWSVSALQRITGSQAPSTSHRSPSPNPQGDDFQAASNAELSLLDDESSPPLAKWQPLRPASAEARDQVIETLRPNDKPFHKQDTMRQQARPKQQSRKRIPGRVQLPLPDPVPAPRSTKHSLNTSAARDELALPGKEIKSRLDQESVDPVACGLPPNNCRLQSGPSGTCSHPFCQSLGREPKPSDGVHLKVHIGMAVFRATKYGTQLNGTFHFDEAEEKLKSAEAAVKTDFFRTLTTSDSDAAFIHDGWQMFGDVRSKNVYEIHFRRSNGSLIIMTLSHSDKTKCSVVTPGRSKSEAYLHYPTHIWDAQIILQERPVEIPLNETLKLFVASLETIEHAPSFKAMAKGADFPVAAYAKRIYSLDRDDLTFSLVQVHELRVQNVGDEQHNFSAYVERPPRWEVTVDSDVEKLPALKMHVDSLVTLMDHVGADNGGIQTKKKKKKVELDDDDDERLEIEGPRYSKFVPADPNNIWW